MNNNETNIETKNETNNETNIETKNKKKMKLPAKILAGTMMICAVMAVGVLFSSMQNSAANYAVALNGEEICLLGSKEDAAQTMDIVVNDFTAEDSSVKAVDAEPLTIIRKEKADTADEKKVAPEEAAALIEEACGSESDSGIRIASTAAEVRTFTPEPDYRKDEAMYAGQTRIEEESKDGSKEVKITYVTVNGEVADKQEEDGEIYDEGKSAVIYKGTRGLPEGADWRTYEGDPVSAMGDAIGDKGLTHLGVPYSKWDCVSFVLNVYKEMGITLPRSHRGIQNFGYGVSYANARKGDIICYPHHVGIYLGNGKMVHSTSSGGVHVGSVKPGKIVTVRRYVGN